MFLANHFCVSPLFYSNINFFLSVTHFLYYFTNNQFLYTNGVENIFAMYEKDTTDTGLTTNDFGWGSATFHKMGRQKIDLAATFTSFGLDLCLCDVDTVWINDPTEYFNSYPAADILASSDQLHPTQPPGDDGLEDWSAVFSPMNIGLLFFSTRIGKIKTLY